MERYDIVAIGGGTAGLTVSSGAAALGARAALIEKDRLGGECLYTGCVPSKAIIRSAKVLSLMKRAEEFGLDRPDISFDFARVMASVRRVISEVGRHDDPEAFEKKGVVVIKGTARFVSPNRLEVDGRSIEAKKIVIATGSRTAVPPIPGLGEAGFIDHVRAFEMERLPRSIVILGGGPIGLEFAQVYARFGVEITVVEMLDQLLPREDGEVAALLQRLLEAEGIKVLVGTKATKVEKRGAAKAVAVEGKEGARAELVAEEIFVATGRRPNLEGLELEAAGVEADRQGVVVDEKLRTSRKHIFAAGDITGKYLFTHVAEYQARLVVRNALFPTLAAKADYRVVPWSTFTDPEVARVGLTEKEAREQYGDRVKVFRYSFADLDRAIIDREARGFIKIVSRPNGEVLGGHIIGPEGGELIQKIVTAMKEGVRVGDLARTIRLYPTLTEGLLRAADFYYREKFAEWRAKLRPLLRLIGR